MRKLVLLAVLVITVTAIAAPASAVKPGTNPDSVEGHKIWICHATASLTNPYVKILIDSAAWTDAENPQDMNDHGLHHTSTKQGVTWSDYALGAPEDECVLDTPPQPPLECPSGDRVDYVFEFDGTKIWDAASRRTLVESETVAAGTYDVILGSRDQGRSLPFAQPNERWRVAFSNGTTVLATTEFSTDLPDVEDPTAVFVTYLSPVIVPDGVTQVLAQHWSVANPDQSNPNSVIPVYVCLVETA